MSDLYEHSLEVLLGNQAPSGAFLATPTMPDYHYCWFRDGSYAAYALDLAGRHAAAHRFHAWAARVIASHSGTVERAEAHAQEGQALDAQSVLHTRYTVDGLPGTQEWANFQLDGFGTWLWAAAEHMRRHEEDVPDDWRVGLTLAGRYLAALWRLPNYDLWEENGDKRHSYTQAAVYAGLAVAGHLLDRSEWVQAAGHVRAEVLEAAHRTGYFTKYLPGRGPESTHPVDVVLSGPIDGAVDGSLVGMALPYAVVEVDDALMHATVERIEATLAMGGGVHRFLWDTYYGGGEWLLLAAWLGWYYAATGQRDRASSLLQWIEAQATTAGQDLPEQAPQNLIAPGLYEPWLAQRGPIASPLLWSHAQYIILRHALDGKI